MEPSTSPHCEMNSTGVPVWLRNFLAASYFTPCPSHASLHKSERNFFCVDCNMSSICSVCVAREHSHHSVLQIRKSSYHDAVRVNDCSKLLDLAGIQVYVINGAKIVFLNGRPQAKPMKGFHCENHACNRTLLDASRFCSISCKLACLSTDHSLTLAAGVASRKVNAGTAALKPTGSVSDDDSADFRDNVPSGFRETLRVGSPFHKRVPGTLPRLPMLVEEHDDASSFDSLEPLRQGFEMMKRLKLEAEEVTSYFPPLVKDEGLEYLQPSTPTMFSGQGFSSSRTHKRKGVPHRSPLA